MDLCIYLEEALLSLIWKLETKLVESSNFSFCIKARRKFQH